MPNYTLSLSIDSEDLRIIRGAHERIILARPEPSGLVSVAWLSIDPFKVNTIEWTEDFSLYASNTEVNDHARINQISSTDTTVKPGYYYAFGDMTFSGGIVGDVPPGSYQVNNNVPASSYPALTFGLAQVATVSSVKSTLMPINAATVVAGRSATFTPFTSVAIWLEANLLGGTVVTDITSKSTVVEFGGKVSSIALHYDSDAGAFVADESAQKGGGAVIRLRDPARFQFA